MRLGQRNEFPRLCRDPHGTWTNSAACSRAKHLSFKTWLTAKSLGFGRENASKACPELWLKTREKEQV